MAQLFRSNGEIITLIAAAAIQVNQIVEIGAFLLGVAQIDADPGEQYDARIHGEVEIEWTSGEVATPGQKIYWNTATKKATINNAHKFIGTTALAVSGTDETLTIILMPEAAAALA